MEPKRFVGLHAHATTGSPGDAIGLPQEHIDFVLSNGGDGLALTDHGSMSGVSHQQIKAAALKKAGIKFRAIPGVEAYFLDSLENWKVLHAQSKVKDEPDVKPASSDPANIGNELANTEQELARLQPVNNTVDEDTDGGTVIEDESETKKKYLNPLFQRNHLVLLPKSNQGLKNLFRIVSESYISGFYKYPRVDYDMLRRHAGGEIIALSACIGGRLAKDVFDNVSDIHVVSTENFELIQQKLKATVERFQEVLGKENFYAELQFNRLPAQHLVNQHLVELAKRTGVKLVATADSHYSNPAHWKEREIYKAMAWASKTKGTVDPTTLPQRVEDLKCELYPKNAEQMWKSYLDTKSGYEFYDDAVVCEAIERTHDIAHQQVGEVTIDKRVKLPSLSRIADTKSVATIQEKLGATATEDDIAFKELVRLAIEGLKFRGRANNDAYVERLKHELQVIKDLNFSKYFLTYHKIMEVVGKTQLLGNARGCFVPETKVKMANGTKASIETVHVGDKVLDAHGKVQEVENTLTYDCDETIVELEFDGGRVVKCTRDHEFLTDRGWVRASDLTEQDEVKEV